MKTATQVLQFSVEAGGRDKECALLLSQLRASHFAVLSGGSGSGKTRLTDDALIPILKDDFVGKNGTRWCVLRLKNPLKDVYVQFATELIAQVFSLENARLRPGFEGELISMLQDKEVGIIGLYRKFQILHQYNILVVLEDFEQEITNQESDKNPIYPFMENLLDATEHKRTSVYLLMHFSPEGVSKLIGKCSINIKYKHELDYYGPELEKSLRLLTYIRVKNLLEDNHIKLYPLSQNDLAAAIRRYFWVNHKLKIFPNKCEELVQELSDLPDQFQLLAKKNFTPLDKWGEALMKGAVKTNAPTPSVTTAPTQNNPVNTNQTPPPPVHTPPPPVQHLHPAEEVYESLPANQQIQAERLFKSITRRMPADGKRYSFATGFGSLMQILNLSSDKLKPIAQAFEKKGIIKVSPPDYGEFSSLEIASEKLMTDWKILTDWMDEEMNCAKILDAYSDFISGKTATIADSIKQQAKELTTKYRFTEAWGEHYSIFNMKAVLDSFGHLPTEATSKISLKIQPTTTTNAVVEDETPPIAEAPKISLKIPMIEEEKEDTKIRIAVKKEEVETPPVVEDETPPITVAPKISLKIPVIEEEKEEVETPPVVEVETPPIVEAPKISLKVPVIEEEKEEAETPPVVEVETPPIVEAPKISLKIPVIEEEKEEIETPPIVEDETPPIAEAPKISLKVPVIEEEKEEAETPPIAEAPKISLKINKHLETDKTDEPPLSVEPETPTPETPRVKISFVKK